MAHFQFAVSGQVLDLLSPTRGISDGLDVNSAEFEFRSKEWENLEKWAHFVNPDYNDGEPQSYELIGDEISSERGLNLTAGIWEVYLTGYLISNGETLKRYVTESQLIMIVQSNIIDESPLAGISPTVEEQVYAKAAEAYNAKITSATATVDAEVGVPDVEVSISGENGTKSLDFSFHNLLANGIREFTVVPSGDNEGYVTIIMENGDTVEFAGIRDALARINALNVTAAEAEVQRVAAEEGRATAEAARVLAEQTRATEFEEWGDFAHYAESYAKGTRGGEDVDPEDPAYHNNSKYYAEQAAGYIAEVSAYASAAATDAERAEAARETVESDTGDAQVAASNSEAWAVGQRNGTDVSIGDDTYHNNSKYYALESATSATAADTSAQAAAASATAAATSAQAAAASATAAATSATVSADGEAWAVGKRGGTDVETTDPTYHNNAKYWAEYAEEHAGQNQDAFSYVQVGNATIAADLPQDTLTLIAGDNVTLTPNADNDSITIAVSEDFAPINSPAFTGTPTAPTQSVSDDSTKIATTAFVHDVAEGLSSSDIMDNSDVGGSTVEDSLTSLKGSLTSLEGSKAVRYDAAQSLTAAQKIQVFSNIFGANNNAGFHNSFFRGKSLGTSFTTAQHNAISAGTFDDMFIGDYWTIGGIDYVICHFDYYYRCSDSDINYHHIVVMPRGVMTGLSVTKTSAETSDGYYQWNETNTTSGGYIASRMRTVIMPACDTKVKAAFGSSYVKTISELYPNGHDASTGRATGWAWTSTDLACDLCNETMVYGAQVWSISNDGRPGYEVGIDKWQLAIFRLYPAFANIRASWWLRSVSSAASAAFVSSYGTASFGGASAAPGVRPRFLVS